MIDNLPCKTQRFSYDDCFYLGGAAQNTARKGGSRKSKGKEERGKRKEEEREEGRGKREEGRGKREEGKKRLTV